VSFQEGGRDNCIRSFEAFDPSHNPQLIVPFCSYLHNTQPLIVPRIVKLHNTRPEKLHDGLIDSNFLWSSGGCVWIGQAFQHVQDRTLSTFQKQEHHKLPK